MLHLHRAERADRLVEALSEVLADPAGDPFTAEVVGVPTRGVERWLTQRLSHRLGASDGRSDGVCANVAFPFPGRLVGGAVAVASAVERDADPWLAERLVWPLIEVVDQCIGEPWLASLGAHLGQRHGAGDLGGGGGGEDAGAGDVDAERRARRFTTVRHIADLFDRYGVHRPAMVRAWAAGQDRDGLGGALPSDAAWQAELWRCVRQHVDVPSPAERLPEACERLRAEPQLLDLPDRLSLFGLTRLPASYLDVLRAVAAHRDVHLFLLHPSPRLWDEVGRVHRADVGALRRSEDPTATVPRNPLVAGWGRDAREMQLVLATAIQGDPHVEHHHPLTTHPATLLERIQADVRADRQPPGVPGPGAADVRPLLDAGDRSVQVHACHGRARQVEAVRDAILHLLADDPTLEPRDVIVLCPDIDTFAPLIHATFGSGRHEGDADDDDMVGELDGPAGHDDHHLAAPPDLRVRLADRALRQTNPVLGAVAALLALASSRLTASQVLDFAGRAPVRRRFRFDDDDVARLADWLAAAGVRWGLDAGHRQPFGLEEVSAHTWRAGLDRLLLGVAMAEDDLRLVGGTLPLDDVDSGDINLAGRVAEFVDRLDVAVRDLGGARPLEGWLDALATAADALCATGEGEAWQRAQLGAVLDDVHSEATAGGTPSTAPLVLSEVRSLFADRLRGRPTRANFRTGHLTMCTLVPMRSVPHRVVCVLGLDDEAFPRRTGPDGDDLVQRTALVGDRDPRTEDRQLLLDALLAAGDHLVVTYNGRDERTNAVRPPAVPLGELLDVVDATVRTGEGASPPPRERIVVRHPLQPFDARNFATGALVADQPWSFDGVAYEGAVAAAGPRRPPAPFLGGPLPPVADEVVELADLVRFVQHPVKAFLRQRLDIVISRGDEEVDDALPVALDPLATWGVGQRLLDARLNGHDPAVCRAAEVARGLVPPGALGEAELNRIEPVVDGILAAVDDARCGGASTSVEVHVELSAGRSLVGSVPGVVGDVLRSVTYSSLAPKHRLAAWVHLLAATVADPSRPWQAVTIGRAKRGAAMAVLGPLGGDVDERRRTAERYLDVLIDLHRRGLREPVPLYCGTSAAYAIAGGGPKGINRARTEWETGGVWDKEDRDPDHRLVLAGTVLLDQLLTAVPAADEGPADGWPAEPTRFGAYAMRLWAGLLQHERLVG